MLIAGNNIVSEYNMNQGTVLAKSKDFALRIVKLYQFLVNEKNEFVLSKQILKSGTSIGANINEVNCAQSRADFYSKMYIAYKESAETQYWLDLLLGGGYISENQYKSMFADCNELTRMLSSITKSQKEEK